MKVTLVKIFKTTAFLLLFGCISVSALAQARTVTTGGNWNNTGIWTGGNIADVIGETATFTANLGGGGVVTVPSPENYTIGGLTMNAGNDLVIANGATLNIGNSTTPANLTAGNNTVITVNGTLIIWGDLDPGGSTVITVGATGVLIIKGDFLGNGDSDFISSGTVDIDGDFDMGGNADITISGPFDVGGNFTFGNDADIILNAPADVNITGNFDGGGNADIDIADGASLDIGGFFDVGADADIGINGDFSVAGDFTATGNLDITVGSTGSLFIGDDVSFGNDADIIVNGDMDVVGDLDGGGNADITVGSGGDFDIGGDVDINNDGDIVVDGSFNIGGDFTGGSNTDFDVDGVVTVGDDLTVGNNSDLTGSGTVLVGGTCTDGTSTFCEDGQLGVLPIKLLYFNVELVHGNEVAVQWATEEELDFDRFEIERAGSNLQFETVGVVQGAGYNTSSRHDYEWVDTNPFVGVNYYRLKTVDLDGSIEYFDVKSVLANGTRGITLFPNPSRQGDRVGYSINFEQGSGDKIIVMDNMGHVVKEAGVEAVQGELYFSEPLKPGFYFVQYLCGQSKYVVRLIVR